MSTVAESPQEWVVTHGRWIVLVCFIGDVRDRVVCVVEGETREWKREWQTAVVFETLEPGEELDEDSIARALHEELDLSDRGVIDFISEKGDLLLSVQRERDRIVFAVRVFLVQLKEWTMISQVLAKGGEIRERWIREVVSLNWDTRPGTLLALSLALDSYPRWDTIPVVYAQNGEEVQKNN
jgi:hypothetical protein